MKFSKFNLYMSTYVGSLEAKSNTRIQEMFLLRSYLIYSRFYSILRSVIDFTFDVNKKPVSLTPFR